jgi:hypothetical protein
MSCSPGGFSAPGPMFLVTLGFAAAAAASSSRTVRPSTPDLVLFMPWILIGLTVVCAGLTFVAWSDCSEGARTCPDCKGHNSHYPWSF